MAGEGDSWSPQSQIKLLESAHSELVKLHACLRGGSVQSERMRRVEDILDTLQRDPEYRGLSAADKHRVNNVRLGLQSMLDERSNEAPRLGGAIYGCPSNPEYI